MPNHGPVARAGSTMRNLDELIGVIRLAKNRTRTLGAVQQVADDFPSESQQVFASLLADADLPDRPKALVLYYLREFQIFPTLVAAHEPRLKQWVDSICRDVEAADDEGGELFLWERPV